MKSKSHLATVKYLAAHASMQCQLVKFQEPFCLENHSHCMNSSKHTAHIHGRMLGNYKCLSETERCAKIQNSIPSRQHNSKRSKGLTII